MLLGEKVLRPQKSSTFNSQILLSSTNLRYPEEVPRVKFVVSTSFLDYAGRQCCEGSPGRPQPGADVVTCLCAARARHTCACLMAECIQSEIALHVGPKVQTGNHPRLMVSAGIPAHKHLTASLKPLLFKEEKNAVVLLVAGRTWTQSGIFALSKAPPSCCLGILAAGRPCPSRMLFPAAVKWGQIHQTDPETRGH